MHTALEQSAYHMEFCDDKSLTSLDKIMKGKMWRLNSLLLASAILAATIVGIGVYGQRHRHRRFTRFIFLGATTLFLPIITSVVSIGSDHSSYISQWDLRSSSVVVASCIPVIQSVLVIIWAFLVQIVLINASAVVAVDDREGQNNGPHFELLVQGVWTLFLGMRYPRWAANHSLNSILGISISLLSIGYCILFAIAMLMILVIVYQDILRKPTGLPQVWCIMNCKTDKGPANTLRYGSLYFVLVPIFLLLVLVVVAEVREIASYSCSNWTKVALICRLLKHTSSQHSLRMKKWVGVLLQCKCKMLVHWDQNMGQCSILILRPRTSLPGLLWRLLRLPDQQRKVKIPEVVKICIMEALRSSRNGRLSNGNASLRRQGQVGESFLWACNSKSTSDTILTWHVATSILEVRHPYLQGSPLMTCCAHKVAAIHLSRYCAYLVNSFPELLPDNDAWSKSLYDAVKEDAERVLASGHAAAGSSSTPEAKYQQLIQVLSANSTHEVLENGVNLGKQLVELTEGEETAWKLLAEFWSEMILYVAPSENLKGHSDAIARGGELITLLWALLFHAGITSRPSDVAGEAPAAATPSDDSSAGTAAGVV